MSMYERIGILFDAVCELGKAETVEVAGGKYVICGRTKDKEMFRLQLTIGEDDNDRS